MSHTLNLFYVKITALFMLYLNVAPFLKYTTGLTVISWKKPQRHRNGTHILIQVLYTSRQQDPPH